ncbi:uromodulin-like isoform X2 [Rana temporaria]|uniref:uromodulin-like isoform X2 n=1 Tax=Rana temporaria TaxID=8407 RepID=UPI001AAD2834|nr:uromodulin-like isoform X2 [Rana temporaria]
MKLHFVIALAILIQYAGAQCIDTWPNPDDSSLANITLCNSCSGSCNDPNLCSCNDGTFNYCLPDVNVQCNDLDLTYCCPQGLYYDKSQSCCTTSPSCVNGCDIDETCTLGVCGCNTSRYQNLRLSDFNPTVICDINTMTVTVSKCELETIGLDSSTIHLKNSSERCNFPYSDSINGQTVTIIQAHAASNWCGNTVTEDAFNINISNTVYIGHLDKPIITSNNISFNFTCVYNRTMQTVLKLPGIIQQTVYLSGANGTGSYPVTMAAYKSPSFTEPYQNNDAVAVGSIIYVGIFVTGADGSQYVLRIESCVASPTDNRSDVNAFYLIKDGCVQETVSTTIDNSKALEASFSISAFQFQNQDYVNLFCDVRLCENTTEICSGCTRVKSFKAATNEVEIGLPIDAKLDLADSAGKHTAASWALLAGIQLAIVFIKFF